MSSTWWPEDVHFLTTQVESEEMQKPSVPPWNEHSPLLQSSDTEQAAQSSVLPRILLGTWRAGSSSHTCPLLTPAPTLHCLSTLQQTLYTKQSHIRKQLCAGADRCLHNMDCAASQAVMLPFKQ
jgi:hypothetical protein